MESLRFYSTEKLGKAGWQDLQRRFLQKYPASRIEKEKRFLTKPTILSYLVSFPAAVLLDNAFLDRLREQHLLAWYEQASEPASLRWLHTVLPREDTSQQALQGQVQSLRDSGAYELRVFNTDASIIGINDATGATFYSPEDSERTVVPFLFSLMPSERLILWCRRQGGEQESVATALFYRDRTGVLKIEASDGISISEAPGQMTVEEASEASIESSSK